MKCGRRQGRDVVAGDHFQTESVTTKTLMDFDFFSVSRTEGSERRRNWCHRRNDYFWCNNWICEETSSKPNRTCNNSIPGLARQARTDGTGRVAGFYKILNDFIVLKCVLMCRGSGDAAADNMEPTFIRERETRGRKGEGGGRYIHASARNAISL